jgi:hypothetical protein
MMDSSSSMLNSSVIRKLNEKPRTVDAVALDKIVNSKEYGIKIDIEGGEYDLRSCANVLRNAKWILGELHYGDFSKPEHRWLINLLRDNFNCVLSAPKVDRFDDQYIVAQTFHALPLTQGVALVR